VVGFVDSEHVAPDQGSGRFDRIVRKHLAGLRLGHQQSTDDRLSTGVEPDGDVDLQGLAGSIVLLTDRKHQGARPLHQTFR
jgi:hypothetical protein